MAFENGGLFVMNQEKQDKKPGKKKITSENEELTEKEDLEEEEKAPEEPEALEAPEEPEALEAPEEPEALEAPEEPKALKIPEVPEALEAPEEPEEMEESKEPEDREIPEGLAEDILGSGPISVPGDKDVVIQLLMKAGMSEEEADRVVAQGEVEGNVQRIIMGSINVPDAQLEIPDIPEESPLIGFTRIIERLQNLESMVFQLEFNLSALLTDLFSRMRQHAIELRESISEHLASRLKMRLFKNFVAESYREVVDAEFDTAERRILSDWLGEISYAFNEYRDNIRVSGGNLRGTVLESEEITRAFLTSLEKEIHSLRGEIREQGAKLDNKENEVEILRYQLETTRGLADLDRELRVKEGEIEYLLEQVRTVENERRNLDTKIQQLEADQESGKRSEAAINRQRETISQQSARIEELERRIIDVRAEQEQMREIRQKAARLEAIEDLAAEKEGAIKDLRTKLTEQESEYSTTLTKLEVAQAELTSAKNTIESLNEKINEMSQLQRKAVVSETLQESLTEKDAQIRELREHLSQRDSELTETQVKLDTLQNETAAAAEELAEKRKDLTEMQTIVERFVFTDETIREQRSELGKQYDVMTELTGKFGAMEAELDSRKEEIQTLKEETNELRERVSEQPRFKRELQLANEQLVAEKERTMEEKKRIDALEREIKELEEEREAFAGLTRSKLETILAEREQMEKTFRHFEQLAKTEPRLEILFLLLKQPRKTTLSVDEITKTVGIVPALVRRYLNELERMGILRTGEDDKVVLLS